MGARQGLRTQSRCEIPGGLHLENRKNAVINIRLLSFSLEIDPCWPRSIQVAVKRKKFLFNGFW